MEPEEGCAQSADPASRLESYPTALIIIITSIIIIVIIIIIISITITIDITSCCIINIIMHEALGTFRRPFRGSGLPTAVSRTEISDILDSTQGEILFFLSRRPSRASSPSPRRTSRPGRSASSAWRSCRSARGRKNSNLNSKSFVSSKIGAYSHLQNIH